MANIRNSKERFAFLALIVTSIIVPVACDQESVAPAVKEGPLPMGRRTSLTPEKARAFITSRKSSIATREIPTGPDGMAYSIVDGQPIANETAIVEGNMNGEQVEVLFRIDPSGSTVDRVTVVASGQQIYAINYVWNSDGTISEITQTAYYQESPGPTRRETGDPAMGGQMDMRSPLGNKMVASLRERFASTNRSSNAVYADGCDAAGIAGVFSLISIAMQVRNASNAAGRAVSPTTSAANTIPATPCLTWIMQQGVEQASGTMHNLSAALFAAGLPFAVNSFQTGTKVWDQLRRWVNISGASLNDIVNTWNKAYSGSCNASSSTRACTSLSYYLMM